MQLKLFSLSLILVSACGSPLASQSDILSETGEELSRDLFNLKREMFTYGEMYNRNGDEIRSKKEQVNHLFLRMRARLSAAGACFRGTEGRQLSPLLERKVQEYNKLVTMAVEQKATHGGILWNDYIPLLEKSEMTRVALIYLGMDLQSLGYPMHGKSIVLDSWNSGIAGVYNPSNCSIEIKEKWHEGVAGVYNPHSEQIEWRTHWHGGIAGVYNPSTKQVEWKSGWQSGVAGVYNPETQKIEWETGWEHGVAGVYNPAKKAVEWKKAWNGGVAGIYNSQTLQAEFVDQWHHGVSLISVDPAAPTLSSASWYGYDVDDDD